MNTAKSETAGRGSRAFEAPGTMGKCHSKNVGQLGALSQLKEQVKADRMTSMGIMGVHILHPVAEESGPQPPTPATVVTDGNRFEDASEEPTVRLLGTSGA